MNKITKPEQPEQKLTPQQRRFVLRSIAEYKTNAWILQALKEQWDIERTEYTINAIYRYSPLYKDQIAKYRASFNAREREHPLFNRQVQLEYLQIGLQIAIDNRDSKAIASLINQIKDITGTAAPTDIEVTHHNGTQSFEDILKTLKIGKSEQVIDAQVEPIETVALPLPDQKNI